MNSRPTMTKEIMALFIIVITILSCSKPVHQELNIIEKADLKDWKSVVESFLQLFGHRNWIVIADAAYPK